MWRRIVFLVEGRCDVGRLRACLLHRMTIMGSYRALRIVVDLRRADCDVIASIGHEPQHALEVLTDRWIRTPSAIILFYKQQCNLCRPYMETNAAIRTGIAVRDELRAHACVESCR
jgi:hypothetical protein